jgi:uncharacterized protein
MAFEFDSDKDQANRERHGFGLSDFDGFDEPPLVLADDRRDYGETRYRAFGRIGGLPHCLVFTYRGDDMRLISFRRAHEEELEDHERSRK